MIRAPRSLRVRLQLWHALILFCVVLSFGSLLYRQVITSRWDEIDSSLLTAARVLEGAMRELPMPVLNSLAQDIGSPRGGHPPTPNHPPAGPPALIPRGSSQLEWETTATPTLDNAWGSSLQLPGRLPLELSGRDGPAYYVIWRSDGSILKQQDVPYPQPERPKPEQLVRQSRLAPYHGTGPLREVFVRGPTDTLICVGRPVGGEVHHMWTLAGQLVLVGVTILGAGLCGGWWLSHSAVEPIERMSQTAEKIHAHNLSDRIELKDIDRELEQLGLVLNDMLSRLEKSFETQRRFAADASHELRTPLATIMSTIELSLSKPRQPEEYQQQLAKCQRAAMRMTELVSSLLQLTRNDAGANPPIESQVDLKEIVEESLDIIRDQALARSVTIDCQLEPLRVLGHASELTQVVTNLLQNAIKYNRDGGSVHVRLREEEGETILSVCDTGIGIAPIDLPHIFERFYRVDKSRGQTSGHGLGLAICQAIIEHHGGSICASSQLGVGSEFVVRLGKSLSHTQKD